MEKARDVIKLQRCLMSLQPDGFASALEAIAQSPFAADAKAVATTVLFCVQFRPNETDTYVAFADLLCEKMPEARSEFLAPFFPQRVKYFPWLFFMQRAFLAGLFTAKEIVDRVSEFVLGYPNEVISRSYLFYYFAPLIQAENRKLYDDIVKGLQKNAGSFGVFYEIKEFVARLPELSTDWKQFWANAALSYPSGSLAAAIRADNIDLFNKLSEDRAFELTEEVMLHSYENIVFPEVNPTVIEFAAYYGARKVIDAVLEARVELKLRRPRRFSFIHFAIAGGFPDIAKHFEERGCGYEGALVTAAQWHRNDLFHWIYENKENEVGLELLLESAAANNVETVLFCLEHGVDVNGMNDDHEGAMHFAAMHGCADVMRLLVSWPGSDVNLGIGHRTPLHVAAYCGFEQVVEALMTRSELDINAVSGGSGGTALQEASKAGHLPVVKALLKREGVDVNGERPTALQQAITHGAAPVAVHLISTEGVDVTVKDAEGRNCMHLAAISGKPEIVSALLAHPGLESLVTERDRRGQTPLHLAAGLPLSDCMSAFIDSGIPLDLTIGDYDGNTPLHAAARNGSARSITRMLRLPNVDVNVRNRNGDTPLHFAARRCRLQPLKALTSAKELNVNVQNALGQSPLHWMMLAKPLDGFGLLLVQKGLECNLQDINGESPIHVAAKSIHIETLRRIIADGRFDPNVCDTAGQNALHKAAKSSRPEALKLILKHSDLDLNKQDENGITPLHFAARSREAHGVQTLLAMDGIDVTVADSNGLTPLHYACAAGTHNIIRCLLEAPGIDPSAKDTRDRTPRDLLPQKDRQRNEQLFEKIGL